MSIGAIDSATVSALSANSAASASTASKLTAEEKKYDVNNDGKLEMTEKAAMLAAEAKEKALKAARSDSSAKDKNDTVTISQQALQMQKQDSLADGAEKTNPKNQAQTNEQRLMNEAITEYRKHDPVYGSDLTDVE